MPISVKTIDFLIGQAGSGSIPVNQNLPRGGFIDFDLSQFAIGITEIVVNFTVDGVDRRERLVPKDSYWIWLSAEVMETGVYKFAERWKV